MLGSTVRTGMGRLLLVMTVVTAMLLVMGREPAEAMSPAQTTTKGVVSLLGNDNIGSIQRFWSREFAGWGRSYQTPRVYYYDHEYGNYWTGCGYTTDPKLVDNGFYCSADHSIYLDYWYLQGLVNKYGDYGAGGFLAHEWGHAVTRMLGYSTAGIRGEYFADCLAGMYTRSGYAAGRLTGSDYGEFYNWLYYQPTSNTHGTGPNRAAWYRYGYQQFNINSCARVFN